MTMSVWATVKESLSYDSENGGNLPAGRFPVGNGAFSGRAVTPFGLVRGLFLPD
jgi:hypothetical protein